MKKKLMILSIYAFTSFLGINAQSQIVSQLSDAVTDLVGSFLDNPYHHSNTLRVNELTRQCKSTLDEMYRQVPSGAQTDFYLLSNMINLIEKLDFMTANIAGYSRRGVDANEWDSSFRPIMEGFGWSWKVLFVESDLVFYEYTKENFKMVLVKNNRSKINYGDYNCNSYECYTINPYNKKDEWFKRGNVHGGNYQFVICCDDEIKYKKITKVSSKRGIGW